MLEIYRVVSEKLKNYNDEKNIKVLSNYKQKMM